MEIDRWPREASVVTITASSRSADILSGLRAELPLVVGFASVVFFQTVGPAAMSDLGRHHLSAAMFVWLFGVMMWCSFRVVRHADVLAARFGEPLGTLVLTIAAVSIEVTIMSTVMLSGDPNPTLPRETVLAILMIVLNGIVGTSILVGAARHVQQQYNLQGATVFLAVISSLAIISLVIPTFTTSTPDPSLTPLQSIVVALLTMFLYGGFLLIQAVRHRAFFTEPEQAAIAARVHPQENPHRGAPRSTYYHVSLLFLTLLPVVLLAGPLAKLLDYGIEDLGAPTAIGGIVIAALVLAPEGLTSLQAAARNHLQRSVNVSLGSALSTIGLTIPVMLTISAVTGTPLELGLEAEMIVLLTLTLFISQVTFSGAPTNIMLGLVHLVLFATFITLIFRP
jgi:Ca2+:H+ antiporter